MPNRTESKINFALQSPRRKINLERKEQEQRRKIYFAMVRLKYTRPLYSSEIDNNPFFGNAPLRLLNLGHYQKCLKVNYKIRILYQIIKAIIWWAAKTRYPPYAILKKSNDLLKPNNFLSFYVHTV